VRLAEVDEAREAGDTGHFQVEEDEVEIFVLADDGLDAVEILRLEDRVVLTLARVSQSDAQGLAKEGMVVGDEDFGHGRCLRLPSRRCVRIFALKVQS